MRLPFLYLNVFFSFAGLFFLSSGAVQAQDNYELQSFENYQFAAPRVAQAYAQYRPIWQQVFKEKNMSWPPKDILIRSFKGSNEMEIWARDEGVDTYRLVQEFPVCAISGSLGPKRWEGDLQIPEGYYFISNFNPRSAYHLSLMLNYPNYSDLIKGNKVKPGGDIYIHGGCVTVGCLPMTDDGIKRIYTLALIAKMNGQRNIPVQVFPVRFNSKEVQFLSTEYGKDEDKHRFWMNLKSGYDYFEKYHKVLPVMYNREGRYVY